ncbi:hypothetical protein [Nocardiopsis ganjiahuensis]|uniref:hypothetical protein n=1 Tax=Nocardiopsis ganjiahuensis TaxID=239984 RepID=UPI000348892A|nr:hypothetical protein [Nocardiopsis ganjiahuensis]
MTPQETDPRAWPAGPTTSGDNATTNTGSGDVNQDSTVTHVSGNQYQQHFYVSAYSGRLRFDAKGQVIYGKERRIVPGDRLATLRRRFVAPPGFDEKENRAGIARHGAVVLSTRPGDGAKAAAQMTLAPVGEEADQDVQDDLVRTNDEGQPFLDEKELKGGERLLVDLTRENRAALGPLHDDLEGLRTRVLRAGASLVVLVEHEDVEWLHPSLKDRVVPHHRPDALAVLAEHLSSRAVPGFFPNSATEKVRTWAATATMGGIEELARRTEAAYREAGFEGRIDDWLSRALGAGEEVLPKKLEEKKGRERAVLLAASLVEGAPVEHLAAGVDSLLDQISFPEDETPLLDRKNFREELRDGEIRVGAERRAYFEQPGRAGALRSAFWDAHPRLHDELGRWVDTLVTNRILWPADQDRVAERWAEQTLRIADPERVFERARGWVSQRRGTAPQAAVLLTTVLRDRRYGREGRQRIYQWAKNTGIGWEFAQVLVAVCAQELAATHPGQAIVRLHLLAVNQSEAVAEAARAELGTLANERPLYRKILRRVCDRLPEHGHPVDQGLFWDLTAPERLVGAGARPRTVPPEVEGLVRKGLCHVLHGRPQQTREYAHRWIGHGAQLREILVMAAVSAGTLPALYTAALHWRAAAGPEERGSRRSAGAALIRLIDTAEGLDSPFDTLAEQPSEAR